MTAPAGPPGGRPVDVGRRALVVMAKAPREGHSKTRLAGALPAVEVVRLSECMLRDTLDLARSLESVHVAVMCPPEDVAALARMLPGADVVGQDGAGLSAALTSVFRRFADADFSRIVAIDADSPHLPASAIEQAFASLAQSDLVVGPTDDGGYYLVGASAPHAGLFDGALGTSSALDALCANARSRGLSLALGRVWYDVDVPADLRRLAADLRSEPSRAPRTAALFAAWQRQEGGRAGANASTPRGSRWSWAAGAVICAALAAVGVLDLGQGTREFFLLLGVASAAYLFAMAQFARRAHPEPRTLAMLVLLAFLARVPLVLAPTHPGADISRYVWDARAVRAGLNPYAVAPGDPTASGVRTRESWPVNNPEVPSPYPPGAQLFFLLATVPQESALAIKVALVACEALLALALWRWLLAIGAGPGWILMYLWNPLVAFEVARIGHVDALGALLVLLAALALARGRTLGATIALALAVAVKPVALVLAPLLWKRISLRDAAAGSAVLAAVYLPFAIRGGAVLGSIPEVVRRFRFNGPVFDCVSSFSTPEVAAAIAVGAGLAIAAWARARLSETSPGAWAWPLAAALLCAPLVYPWYLVWLAPFLFGRSTLPLLVWTVSIQPVYVVWALAPRGARWAAPTWALLVEYGALAISAGWTWLLSRRQTAPEQRHSADGSMAAMN
jgi:rSAM/selenodomain-associated transferase 1